MGSQGGDGGASIEAARIQAQAAERVAQLQGDAGLEAARLQTEGAREAQQLNAALTREAIDAQNAQFYYTDRRFQPFVDVGRNAISDVNAGADIDGFSNRLDQIMATDQFQGLRDQRQRSADAQLSAAGLTRSGAAAQAAADIDTDLALALEGQLFSRSADNLRVGQASAAQVGAAGASNASSIGGILSGAAGQQSNLLLQGANAAAGGVTNQAIAAGSGIQGAANAMASGLINQSNVQQQNRQNRNNMFLQTGLAVAQIFSGFSDERLKKNMKKIGKVKDLNLYEWDWKEDAKDVAGCDMSTGFKAQEVKEKYPECVYEAKGFLAVDYSKLIEQMEAA